MPSPDVIAILNGPHEYRNGQYVSTVPTPQQLADAEFEKNKAAVQADLNKVIKKESK